MPYPAIRALVLAVSGGGGAGEEPQLIEFKNWEPVIWAWVIFLLAFLILRKLAWKPLLQAVEERERKIAESLEKAEEVRRASEEIARRQESALAEAHVKAKAVLDDARVAAERYRAEQQAKARSESDAFLERAKKEIALEENRARDALRREVVELTLTAASRVLERNLTSEDDRRLAEQVVAEVRARRAGASN